METRRGFLKTLGKLTAAVGLTTAAACSANHHGQHRPKHPRKAKPHTTPKAQQKHGFTGFKPANPKDFPITHAANVCVTNRDEARNAFYNTQVDTIAMAQHPPQMVVPRHIYAFSHRKEAIRHLDPDNWGAVFDLKWYDWKAADPEHATVTGRWVATVKPQFVECFDGRYDFVQSQSIGREYLISAIGLDVERVKEVAKDQCYRGLVCRLKEEILERISREVRAQPVRAGAGATSPRDLSHLKGITD